MLSVRELKQVAAATSDEDFEAQLGPFVLVRRPPELEVAKEESRLALLRTQVAWRGPDNPVSLILEFIFDFDALVVERMPLLPLEAERLVGRLPQCQLVVDHPSVSKQHAAIRWSPGWGRWTLEDLDSTNGTYVDGESAIDELPLRDGAVLSLGDVDFWFLSTLTLYGKLIRGPSAP
jgi:hypothetical protein